MNWLQCDHEEKRNELEPDGNNSLALDQKQSRPRQSRDVKLLNGTLTHELYGQMTLLTKHSAFEARTAIKGQWPSPQMKLFWLLRGTLAMFDGCQKAFHDPDVIEVMRLKGTPSLSGRITG